MLCLFGNVFIKCFYQICEYFISIDLKKGDKVTFEISQLPVLNLVNRFYTDIRTAYFDDLILAVMGVLLTVIFGFLYRSRFKNKA